jgi:hypothetical protein
MDADLKVGATRLEQDGCRPRRRGVGATRKELREKSTIAIGDELHEGAGRMPAPQRARRPRYAPSVTAIHKLLFAIYNRRWTL